MFLSLPGVYEQLRDSKPRLWKLVVENAVKGLSIEAPMGWGTAMHGLYQVVGGGGDGGVRSGLRARWVGSGDKWASMGRGQGGRGGGAKRGGGIGKMYHKH